MNTTETEISNKVSELLASAKITYSARYVGETVRDDKWKCDAWRVSFTPANGRGMETDYFTGLGLRKAPAGMRPQYPANTTGRIEWERRWLKPQQPTAADVLHSLVLDAEADYMSFRDWCDNFGYSDDSLQALDCYRACCETAVKLRTVFRPETLAAIREAVQEL